MKLLIRLAFILAGSAAIPAGLPGQIPGGLAAAPPAPAAVSTNGLGPEGILGGFNTNDAPVSTNGLGPRIQFNTENYNAGTNFPGDVIQCTFVATNTGDDILEISNVQGSCSCVVVGEGSARNAWTTQKVAPGQICRIPVEVSAPGNIRGQLIRTVMVTSNDRMRPSVVLQISSVVWAPVEVAPEMAVLSFKADSTNLATHVLKIFNRMATPLTLSDPKSSTNAFSAVLKTNVPGQEFELTVSAAPPASLPSSFSVASIQGNIFLQSSVTNRNPLTIPVIETVTPEITVYPSILPVGPLDQPSRNLVTIHGNVADLAVSDPAVNAPGVGVALTTMQTNRLYVVIVIFPRGFEVRSGQNVALTVKTDNPRFPVITVPITPKLGVTQPLPPAAAVPPVQTSLLAPAGPRSGLPPPAPATNAPAGPLLASAAPSTNNLGPQMRFNTEAYDAGTNLAGDLIRYTFVVTNTGDETLVLSNVIPGCPSCTVVGESAPAAITLGAGAAPGSTNTWTREIAPGRTGVIPVQILTDNLRGPINKPVTVLSNDRERPNVTVHITGTVLQPIEVVPSMAVFYLPAGSASNNTQVFKISNQTKVPLALSDPQSSTNAFSAVLKTNLPGQEYELTVTAAPVSGLPASFSATVIQGEISLHSSYTNLNPLRIGLFETISPEVTVSPANILLPAGPLAQATTNHIVIRGLAADLMLSGPGANVPGVEVSLNVIQPNHQYYLSVAFPKGFEIQPGQSVVVTVKSNHPRFPVLSIPVKPMIATLQSLPPPVPAPMRTSVLPASILARLPANSSNAPALPPDPPLR